MIMLKEFAIIQKMQASSGKFDSVWQQGLPSTFWNPSTLVRGAFFEAAKLEKHWPEMCELVNNSVSNRKGGIRTQTAASSHRLWSSAENVKSIIHPATHWGNTLSLQGTAGWCLSLLCSVCITPTLETLQIPPWDKWGMWALLTH